MDPQREQVAALVERVLARVRSGELEARPDVPTKPHGAYATVDDAVGAARKAHETLRSLPLERRKEIVANVRRRTAEQAHSLSRLARDETGLGRTEDKVKKNLLVIGKTPGPEILESGSYTGDDGLTLVERAPYGVIASITPCTNPTETIINNGIGMISGANAVVFNTHPLAKGVSATCIDVMNRASIEVGGPDDILTCIADPTIASATEVMRHAGVALVVVTGGGDVVKAAMNSGKKCVAAGPGNPPVVVDETADLDAAARGIVMGASLDNNIVCTDEKEVLAVTSVLDALLERVVAAGAVQIRNHAIARLEKLVLTADPAHKGAVHIDRRWVGKSAGELLREIDVPFQGDPRLVVCEVPFDHPFVQHELLMPIIGFVRMPDVEVAIDRAVEVEHGFRHTASMYSRNIEALHRMARAVDTSIFVKNAPNYAGLGMGGEGYTSFTIASPTGDGLTTARTFTRERRCTLAGYFRIV